MAFILVVYYKVFNPYARMVLVLRTVGAHASHSWCLPRTRHGTSYNTMDKDGWEEVYLPHCEL